MSRICICISFDNFELNLEMRFEQKERRLHRLLISIDRQHQPVARNRQNQVSKNMTSSSRGKTGQNRLNKQNIDIPVKLNTLTLVNSIIHSKNKQTCSNRPSFRRKQFLKSRHGIHGRSACPSAVRPLISCQTTPLFFYFLPSLKTFKYFLLTSLLCLRISKMRAVNIERRRDDWNVGPISMVEWRKHFGHDVIIWKILLDEIDVLMRMIRTEINKVNILRSKSEAVKIDGVLQSPLRKEAINRLKRRNPSCAAPPLLFSHGKKLDTTQRGASQGGFLLLSLFIWGLSANCRPIPSFRLTHPHKFTLALEHSQCLIGYESYIVARIARGDI